MYTLKGFFTFDPLIDNTRHEVSPFGELSSDASTFAKDKTYHTNNEAGPQTTLIAFTSKSDGAHIEPPSPVAVTALKVGQWLLDRAMGGTLSTEAAIMLQNLQNEFTGVIESVSCGEIEETDSYALPRWVSFKDSAHDEDNKILVWLSDEAFRSGYTDYTIEVVPPIEPLDDFFRDSLAVRDLLVDYDIVEKMDEVQVIRGDYPYTQLLARRYDYVNPSDDSFRVPSTWMVMVYGQAGNNPDIIKNALIDYVLENSEHTRDEWATVLPDLFLTTEFVVTPFWNSYAIPNRELEAGIYSPTIRPQQVPALLQQTVRGPNYTNAWIEAEYELSSMIYKSLGFAVVANPQNDEEVSHFSKAFSDYIIVTNDSPDYNRMSVPTQEFLDLFFELIRYAEELDDVTDLPVYMSKITRDGVEYVASLYDNVTYLIVSKRFLETL